MPKKPQGFHAVARVSSEATELLPLSIPADKASAEDFIMNAFVSSLGKIEAPPLSVASYARGQEDDLDFQIETPVGPRLLELTEVAPQQVLQSGGFQRAPNTYTVGQLADFLSDAIYRKDRYRTNPLPILLVYAVHYAFMPSDNVLVLVRSKLASKKHSFEKVILFQPMELDFGIVTPLYPYSPLTRLSLAQRTALRSGTVTNFDPRKAEHVPGQGIMFRFDQT